MEINYYRVVQGRIGRTIINSSVVGECIATADGIVAQGSESVFHPKVYNHVTVAAVASGVHIQVRACGIESGVGIDKGMTGTYGVVAIVAESILHKKMHHHVAVASENIIMTEHEILAYSMVHTLIREHLSGADSVVAMCAYGVVDMQADKHCAVAALCR